MKDSPTPVLLTTEGFTARTDLKLHVETKAAKLFRHSQPRVHLVRIAVKRHTPHSSAAFFVARGIAENDGLDHCAHANGNEPEAAVNALVAKLERALSATAGALKRRLHTPRPAEVTAATV